MALVKNKIEFIGWMLLMVAVMYLSVSMVWFSLRHPWMTSTEKYMFIMDGLMWRTVTIDEVRSYEGVR